MIWDSADITQVRGNTYVNMWKWGDGGSYGHGRARVPVPVAVTDICWMQMHRGQLSSASQRASEPAHCWQDGRTWAIIGASSGLPRVWPGPATSAAAAFGQHPRRPVAQGWLWFRPSWSWYLALVPVLGASNLSSLVSPFPIPYPSRSGGRIATCGERGRGGSSGFLECGLRRSVELPSQGVGIGMELKVRTRIFSMASIVESRLGMMKATAECKRTAGHTAVSGWRRTGCGRVD